MAESFRGHSTAAAEIRPLTPREFDQIRKLAHERFGLDLRSGKEELVSARLNKKIRQWGFRTFQQYFDYVLNDASGEALTEMIDSLTTNHTMFLREPAHFEFLRDVIAVEYANRPITIWSAACSTGEEPYSIAITLLDRWGMEAASRIRILALDISTRALGVARQGVYSSERFDGFPKQWLPKYFLRGEGEWKGWYRVRPQIRKLIDFRNANLMEPLTGLPQASIIFCRNVMIYFDKPTQDGLLRRLVERIEPGGYLLTGHSESLLGGRHALEYIRPAVYRRPGGDSAPKSRTKDRTCVH
jgi:chemotaxis protein methyltransferase CheR